MAEAARVETGTMGRVAYGRLAPSEDLVQGVEKLCLSLGMRHAFVRSALGSLVDACLDAPGDSGECIVVRGPAIEVLTLHGEVRPQADGALRAQLHGVVVDTDGRIHGGPFVAGANPVCVTFEVTLEEWLPS